MRIRALKAQRSEDKQARQDLNLQPPVLESSASRVHRGTMQHNGSGIKHLLAPALTSV